MGSSGSRLSRAGGEQARATKPSSTISRAGGGLGHHGAAIAFSWSDVGKLLRKRQILGASIGQFCGNSTLVFFLTWFPTYLATERHMDWLKSGFFAVLPYHRRLGRRAGRRL